MNNEYELVTLNKDNQPVETIRLSTQEGILYFLQTPFAYEIAVIKITQIVESLFIENVSCTLESSRANLHITTEKYVPYYLKRTNDRWIRHETNPLEESA